MLSRISALSSPDRAQRFPRCEDDQRDGQPAEGFDRALVLPGALDVVHDVVRAAEAGDTGADAGGKVLVLCDVDTGSVSRGGIFADGAQAQACAGLRQEEPDRNGEDDRHIGQKAVGEQERAQTELAGEAVKEIDEGKRVVAECLRGHGYGDLADAAGELVEAPAEEVADAGAEDRQGQAGDVLVRAQRDGQEAVDEAAKRGGEERRDETHNDAQRRARLDPCVDAVDVFIHERGRQTGDAAEIHDTGNAEVEVAGFLRDDLAERAEHDNRAEHDGRVQKVREFQQKI